MEERVCDYLIGGGFGYDYPPEYCDLEVEDPNEDYCPMHLRIVWGEDGLD